MTTETMTENPRLTAARRAVEAAQREVARIERDLATREQSPDFQLARALYARGWRVSGWGLPLTDTDNETRLWNVVGKVPERLATWIGARGSTQELTRTGYWADGANRSTEEAYEALERAEPDLCAGLVEGEADPLSYLDDLTAEDGE